MTKAEDATFVLTSAMELEDGTVVYEVLDTMRVEGDRLVTKSPPYAGLLLKKVLDKIKSVSPSFKKLKTSNKILDALGLPGIQETLTHQLLLPYMMLVGHSTDIIGNVYVTQLDENGLPTGEKKPVIGAVVALEQPQLVDPDQPPFLPPGKLRPGTFVASSRGPAGFFVLRVDTTFEGAGFQLTATHPRFPGQRALATGAVGTIAQRFLQGDISQVELLFGIPPASAINLDPDTTPPQVRAAHIPQAPTAGLVAAPGATFNVVAFDDREISAVTAAKLDVEAFGTQPLDIIEGVELVEESTLSPTPDRVEKQFRVRCLRAGRVTIALTATDVAGNIAVQNHAIDFSRPPLVPPAGGTDTVGPRVVFGWPPANAVNQAAFPDIRLRFSEPLPARAFEPGNTDWVTFASGHFVTSLEPSVDRRDVVIRFAGAPSDPVSMSVGSPLTDDSANGNAFDQNPDTSDNQPYNLSFTLTDAVQGTLDTVSGGGAVGDGVRAFALDRSGSAGGELVCYDLSDPAAPARIGSLSLPSRPADLVYLPSYSLRRTLNGPVETLNLVVAVGGINGTGGFGDITAAFKWMWVIDVTDASTPTRIASGNISQDVTSLVVKVAAAMPLLAYLETSGDVTAMHFVDLPAFIIGHNSTAAERATFHDAHNPGIDLNGDGDYVDAGERTSIPARTPPLFFGEFFSFAPPDQADRIVDFDFSPSGVAAAVTFNIATGKTVYRNILSAAGALDDTEGTRDIPGEEAKRVFLVDGVRMTVGPASRLLNLALVSLRVTASPGPRIATLAVLDITDPAHPVPLGEMPMEGSDGIPQSIKLRADGLLALATSNDILILDPERQLLVDALGRSLAVVSRISGLGGGMRAFVSDAANLHVVNAGSKHVSAFSGPTFELVTFPQTPQTADTLTTLSDEAKVALLQSAIPAPILHRAKITIQPPPGMPQAPPVPSAPLPEDHYFVVCRIPGSATGTASSLPLVLETVNTVGTLPSVDASGLSLPSVVVDPTTLQQFASNASTSVTPSFPLTTRAFRMSNNPGSPLYNVLLAGPVTLHTTVTLSEAAALTAQLRRTMLRLNKYLVVALPPNEGATFFDPFRSIVAGQTVVPGANRIVPIDFKRNPVIFIPGIAGSHLERDGVASTFISEAWPGYTGLLQNSLSLEPPIPPAIPPTIVASDIIREIPESYNQASGVAFRLLGDC